ncbi:class I SAM-dependent methyltransferase [Stackebrandtia soli]|uniref:class I SAM-dependent methyltransferase n=1 Tax=Stackebrandtia soli TaxID=1892856 RepID=UPI0039E79A26
MEFDKLIDDAEQTDFEGWDFSVFGERFHDSSPSWDYTDVVARHLNTADSLLDMGTGGGEFLADLPGIPAKTVATEGWEPNVAVARHRLEPLGIEVVQTYDDDNAELPFPDEAFSLVINRHEAYTPAELRRVLRPGGVFVTQQVGGTDLAELNEAFGEDGQTFDWDLSIAVAGLESAAFEIVDAREERQLGHFTDIGAVALYLRVIPWQIPGFTVENRREQLRALHERIRDKGPFEVNSHRFLIVARVPD